MSGVYQGQKKFHDNPNTSDTRMKVPKPRSVKTVAFDSGQTQDWSSPDMKELLLIYFIKRAKINHDKIHLILNIVGLLTQWLGLEIGIGIGINVL